MQSLSEKMKVTKQLDLTSLKYFKIYCFDAIHLDMERKREDTISGAGECKWRDDERVRERKDAGGRILLRMWWDTHLEAQTDMSNTGGGNWRGEKQDIDTM